ncbi:hypothetical protein [Salinarimonas sp.]|uniref:hypothetical protein n=1 Tax=Salinarimonas sp. TaxID=2766526 RepID=UPI0032D95A69
MTRRTRTAPLATLLAALALGAGLVLVAPLIASPAQAADATCSPRKSAPTACA